MKIGKYLTAEKLPLNRATRKTCIWSILGSDGVELGTVEWYPRWRQYCFMPHSYCVFSAGCLRELAAFLDSVKQERNTQGAA